jgi:hypothetical protein
MYLLANLIKLIKEGHKGRHLSWLVLIYTNQRISYIEHTMLPSLAFFGSKQHIFYSH